MKTQFATTSQFFASMVLSLLLAGCAAAPKLAQDPCLKRHAAVDIGSGTTKGLAVIVDICQTPKRVVEKLVDERLKISFADATQSSGTDEIPPMTITDASAKIATLIETMNSKGLDRLTIVATAAFRKAKNGPAAAQAISTATKSRVSEKTNLPPTSFDIQILSQNEEAAAGARSAIAALAPEAKATSEVFVWDIGGGSMQIWSQSELFTGDLASVSFKNRVLMEIQKKKEGSPNPLKNGHRAAVAMAKKHAKENVSTSLKKKAPTARWIGIGGVLAISTLKQVEKEAGLLKGETAFTAKALAEALPKRAQRSDEELESDYAATDVTNLALVLGYMQELKIPQVETVDASLVQGLVLE